MFDSLSINCRQTRSSHLFNPHHSTHCIGSRIIFFFMFTLHFFLMNLLSAPHPPPPTCPSLHPAHWLHVSRSPWLVMGISPCTLQQCVVCMSTFAGQPWALPWLRPVMLAVCLSLTHANTVMCFSLILPNTWIISSPLSSVSASLSQLSRTQCGSQPAGFQAKGLDWREHKQFLLHITFFIKILLYKN